MAIECDCFSNVFFNSRENLTDHFHNPVGSFSFLFWLLFIVFAVVTLYFDNGFWWRKWGNKAGGGSKDPEEGQRGMRLLHAPLRKGKPRAELEQRSWNRSCRARINGLSQTRKCSLKPCSSNLLLGMTGTPKNCAQKTDLKSILREIVDRPS